MAAAAQYSSTKYNTTKAGAVARKLAEDKVLQYISAFTNFKKHEIIAACAEAEGAIDVFFLDFIKRRIEDGCESNPALIRSRVATEVYERLSVAIQRANADGVIGWRYAEFGESLSNSDTDPVFAALNSAPINLAECDSDLRRGGDEVEEEAGGLVADGVAGGPGAARGDSEAEAAGLGDGRGSGDAREEAARAGVLVGDV
jgi:hypothetical protein